MGLVAPLGDVDQQIEDDENTEKAKEELNWTQYKLITSDRCYFGTYSKEEFE